MKPDFKVISQAILNDAHIKELTIRLAELYQKAMPTIILTDNKVRMSYDPDVEALAKKIKILIEQRKEQIVKANLP